MSLIGLLAVAVPIIVIGGISMSQSMGSITDLARNKMGETARSLASGLDLILGEQIVFVSNLTKFDSVVEVIEDRNAGKSGDQSEEFLQVQKTFTEIKDSLGDRVSSVVLIGKDRTIFLSSDDGKFIGLDLTGRDYVNKVFQGESTVGSVGFFPEPRATSSAQRPARCTAGPATR